MADLPTLVGEKWLRDGDPSWVRDSPTAHLPQGFPALWAEARCQPPDMAVEGLATAVLAPLVEEWAECV
jgi:hypothetical protein